MAGLTTPERRRGGRDCLQEYGDLSPQELSAVRRYLATHVGARVWALEMRQVKVIHTLRAVVLVCWLLTVLFAVMIFQ